MCTHEIPLSFHWTTATVSMSHLIHPTSDPHSHRQYSAPLHSSLSPHHLVSHFQVASQHHTRKEGKNSPLSPTTPIPNPTTRARRAIATPIFLPRVPSLNWSRNGCRAVVVDVARACLCGEEEGVGC